MQRIIVTSIGILLTIGLSAQTFTEWQQRANQGDVLAYVPNSWRCYYADALGIL